MPEMGLGQPLGILPQPALDLQTVVIPSGGVLLLYTDGVTEAIDPGGNFFETERLYETARQTAGCHGAGDLRSPAGGRHRPSRPRAPGRRRDAGGGACALR